MKKILLIIFSLFIIVGCKNIEPKYLNEFDEYKNLNRNNILNIEKIRFTEAGDIRTIYDEDEEIDNIFNYVTNIKLGEETNMTCEDNTTIYKFYLKDNKTISIEIECNWVIIDKKRYLIIK